MNKENGFVLIWRSLTDKGYYKKSQYVHLWLHLIFKANHKDTTFLFNKKETVLQRGQFITGRKTLSEETGIGEGTIENILKTFENEQQILQQKTNLFRIITIINYDKLQKFDNKIDNKVTTKLQQNDTDKALKALNTLKEKEKSCVAVSLLSIFEKYENDFIEEELKNKNSFIEYWTEKNERGKKERWQMEKVFDVKKRFRTWLKNEKKWGSKKKGVDHAEEWNGQTDKRKFPVDIE